MKSILKKIVKIFMPYGAIVLYSRHKNQQNLNYCPICEQYGKFLPEGVANGRRERASCPNCGSMERHRLVWLFIIKKIGLQNISKKQHMLHVAAEPVLEKKLRPLIGEKYLTADLYEEADVKMDITDIQYPDETFDIIIANHILEHVSDDLKAMRELFRVQRKSGWAILLTPIADMPTTYEDKSIKSKKGRFEAYGQDDHVRKYGRDYMERLRSVGYKVGIYRARDLATKKDIKKMSLIEKGNLRGFLASNVYICLKDEKAIKGLSVA